MARLSSVTTQLVVSDVVATAQFYKEKLGFHILGYFLNPPVYVMVERDGIQIHFGKADSLATQESNIKLRKEGFDLYFWVNDVDELYQEFVLKQVNILEKPVDRVYGNRELSLLDCNGFKLVFGQK